MFRIIGERAGATLPVLQVVIGYSIVNEQYIIPTIEKIILLANNKVWSTQKSSSLVAFIITLL